MNAFVRTTPSIVPDVAPEEPLFESEVHLDGSYTCRTCGRFMSSPHLPFHFSFLWDWAPCRLCAEPIPVSREKAEERSQAFKKLIERNLF